MEEAKYRAMALVTRVSARMFAGMLNKAWRQVRIKEGGPL
jgi:hypothetical protein